MQSTQQGDVQALHLVARRAGAEVHFVIRPAQLGADIPALGGPETDTHVVLGRLVGAGIIVVGLVLVLVVIGATPYGVAADFCCGLPAIRLHGGLGRAPLGLHIVDTHLRQQRNLARGLKQRQQVVARDLLAYGGGVQGVVEEKLVGVGVGTLYLGVGITLRAVAGGCAEAGPADLGGSERQPISLRVRHDLLDHAERIEDQDILAPDLLLDLAVHLACHGRGKFTDGDAGRRQAEIRHVGDDHVFRAAALQGIGGVDHIGGHHRCGGVIGHFEITDIVAAAIQYVNGVPGQGLAAQLQIVKQRVEIGIQS